MQRLGAGSAHPDNVAPCLCGGFVLVRRAVPPDVIRLPVPHGLTVVVVHPELEIETAKARALLGNTVPLSDAVRQWANLGALVDGLHRSDFAQISRALEDTIAYVKQRHAFGQPIAAFQNTQFTLAELATQVEIGQAFVDKLLAAHVRGEDVVKEASMGKWWTTDLQKQLTAECLQLHGGYGFMAEYPISGDYADAAVQSIYAGTNEIMKVIIARRLGLG